MAGDLYYSIVNTGETDVHILQWTIPNFVHKISHITTKELYSQHAYCNESTKVEPANKIFQLKIKGYEPGDTEVKSIALYYLSSRPVFILNTGWLYFKSEEYSPTSLGGINHDQYLNIPLGGLLSIPSNEWVGGWNLCKCSLKSSEGGILKWCNNDLIIKCVFTVSNKNIRQLFPSESVENESLSNAFEKFINNDLFSDVTIRSVEGDEFKAHKVILASRSAVLKAHFEHNTTECQTNCVESPLHADVLREIINFIYTDKAQRIDEIPELLLAAADYYDLKNLKTLCEDALVKKLTIDNAIDFLQLAELHSASSLKDKTQQFIKANMKLIVKSDSWKNIESVELIKNIVEYIHISKD